MLFCKNNSDLTEVKVDLETLAIIRGYIDAYPKNPSDDRSM